MSAQAFKTSNARASHIRNLFFWEPKPQWNRESVVLITGGASGIGRQLARLYADRDARIVICDINHIALEETVIELRTISRRTNGVKDISPEALQQLVQDNFPGTPAVSTGGAAAAAEGSSASSGGDPSILLDTSPKGKCIFGVKVDVTKESDCQRFIDTAIKLFGRIDNLILCAGIGAHNIFAKTKDLSVFHKCMVRNGWRVTFAAQRL